MAKIRGSWFGRTADRLINFFSGEWILEWSPYTANGGTVVAIRSLWLTFWVFFPAFVLKTSLGEGKIAAFDPRQGAADFVESLPWIAAIFAGVYVALYTRFSSQWTYLANLFNQIVQAQLALPETPHGGSVRNNGILESSVHRRCGRSSSGVEAYVSRCCTRLGHRCKSCQQIR
ncbi:MAG TPA: hypothetical protein VM053_11980 [Gemmatimonadaceae bacterium]|nr:hypothetical protein [Gemmatimonadaceae bacterium]